MSRAGAAACAAFGADGQVGDREFCSRPEPRDDQRSLSGTGPEIALALADFDCREQTDYMGRMVAMHREAEEQVVKDNQEALEDLLNQVEARIEAG
jgi:hypothetical protein